MPVVITELTERDIVAACRKVLSQWPRARAAVLFGSRARGTAHLNSDWDVAIVLEGDEPRQPGLATSVFPRSEVPDALVRIDAWALSEDDLRRRCHILGTLPYAVCRDGRVLAGEWTRPGPEHMERECAVDPEDWASRMRLVVVKVHAALAPICAMAGSGTWAVSGGYCSVLLQVTADAAELLVKAAIERRGVPADRSHDIAGLAAEFAAQRPNEHALAQRMAALNGDSRGHHVAMHEFRPPVVPDVEAAVGRLAGTLDLWASEIEPGTDGMAAQLSGLAHIAADQAAAWPGQLSAQVKPKTDEGHPTQAAVEAALEGRPVLAEAIASFRDRMQRVVDP